MRETFIQLLQCSYVGKMWAGKIKMGEQCLSKYESRCAENGVMLNKAWIPHT